jgi:hypothetical protein
MMWATIVGESHEGCQVTHVIPLNDTYKHELRGDCWCTPELDYEELVAVHNSADNREAFESGERKPS